MPEMNKKKPFPLATLVVVGWTLTILTSLGWNVYREREQMFNLARSEAQANFNKDITFRRWGTNHGGVYVPVTERQQPVPWLSHVPQRDVVTSDGQRLTLLNPASMLRQMMDEYAETYGVRGRITGLKYLNPGNAPDDWERAQLEAFVRGERTEAWAVSEIGGKPYMRYIQAMVMEEGCIKCHAVLGYTRVGEVRGGIGVSVPLAPYRSQYEEEGFELSLSHGGIWLIGMLGIGAVGRTLRQRRRERERMVDELAEREERLKLALHGADLGLWDWDLATGKVVFNERWAQMLGYRLDEIEPHVSSWGRLVHPDDMPRVREVLDAHLEGRTPSYETEHRMKAKSGAWVWVLDRGRVIERDAKGAPLRAVGTHLDITERKRAEETMRDFAAALETKVNERTAELQRAYKELESFSYSISHDLRTPLRAINGYASVLEEDEKALGPESRELLERIKAGAVRMGELIDDMLDFTRLGRSDFIVKEVHMTPLVRGVVAELAEPYPNAGIVVGELGKAACDPVMIRQAWINLIGNALKFSAGQEHPRIEIGCRDEAGRRVYFVRDNGVGFDGEHAGKLFGVFQRLHRAEDFAGTGIGLAVVKRIVERHGGRVWAESRAGEGATFFFTLGA
jgi:PAS domain S-box-containing protein